MQQRFVLHKNDLPADVTFGNTLAIDGEFMGLNVHRDRLCLLQIYDGQGLVHIVQFNGNYDAPNLKKLLSDALREKLFFYARADMKWIAHYLGVMTENNVCLRIASRIARSFTQDHDLEVVVKNMLGIKIAKDQQSSDWGAAELTAAQLDYACNDVLYLHALREKLDAMMQREGRLEIAQGLYHALPAVIRADLAGWGEEDLLGYVVARPI
jgi:ribonuclease D